MTENRIFTMLKIGFLALLVFVLYYPDLHSMVAAWVDKKEYSHGFLIPLLSGYIIWRDRDILRNTSAAPDIKGLFLLSAGIFLLVLGNIGFEPFTRGFSLIVTILGLSYFLLGRDMCKKLLFPVGYLVFMIPLPYIIIKSISVNLRLISAKVTYSVLNFMDVPILRDGANLELPQMSLIVGDLCTGILSLVAVMALAVLYAYLTQKHWISRLVLILLAAPIAIFSNMIRLIMTVGLVYLYGQKVLGSLIHQFHGTVNFFITVFLLVLTSKLIKKIDIKISKKASA